jgi:hypothetical protein
LGKKVTLDDEAETIKCPRCSSNLEGFPAISRTDNKTEICSPCGQTEAMEAFVYKTIKTQDMWPTHEGFAKQSYWNKMNKLSGLITDLTKKGDDKNE